MGRIFASPEGIDKPQFKPGQDWKEFDKLEADYEAKIVAWAKEHGKGPEAGEKVRFPVADGYAVYVIVSLKPIVLIHIDTGDAWQYQYVNRLTASDLRKQIAGAKAMRELFSKKQEPAAK
jgi:hypothetical protein